MSKMSPKKRAKKDKEPGAPQVVKITIPSDKQNWDRDLPKEHGKYFYCRRAGSCGKCL